MIYDILTRTVAKFIGLYDPMAALRYLSQHQAFQQRAYMAAKKSGPDSAWRTPTSSGATENASQWQAVTNKARDLARNNPYIVGARRRHRANLICEGIWPRPKILKRGAQSKFELESELNADILRRWEAWAPVAGANGDSIYQIQRTAANHFFDDGQFLIQRLIIGRELRLKLIECDHLDKSRDRLFDTTNTRIVGGIEMDINNKPVAYWLYKLHPAEQVSESVRIPASGILHVFDRQRASEVSGICGYASVVQSVFRLNEYAYSTMDAARFQNHFGVWIESPYLNDWGEIAKTDAALAGDAELDSRTEPKHSVINPAGFHYGLPGEKPHSIRPEMPGSQYDPFMTRELQTVATGAGVGYEAVSSDGSRTNFAGSRGLLIVERGYTRMNQAIFEEQLHTKVYEWFIEHEVSFGKPPLRMPGYDEDKQRYLRARYNRPIQEWVDPLKDSKARESKIKSRLTTEMDEAEDMGRDIEEIYQTIQYQQKLREQYGIKDERVTYEPRELDDDDMNGKTGGKEDE